MPKQARIPPATASCPCYVTTSSSANDASPVINITNRPLQFGVFFDGTGNNLENDISNPFDNKEPTNIAKLHLVYPRTPQAKIDAAYIEGVGTEASEEDKKLDMAFATSFGEKLQLAIILTQGFFDKSPKAPVGLVDVFGFSRGAAAARAFVNEVHRINRKRSIYRTLAFTLTPDYPSRDAGLKGNSASKCSMVRAAGSSLKMRER